MTLPQKNNNITTQHIKRLSVQVSLTGLSFLVTSAESKKVLFFSEKKLQHFHTPEELGIVLKNIVTNTPELQDTFKSSTLIYATQLFALVPKPFFNENNLSNYLKFNTKLLPSDFIAFDDIVSNEMATIYVPFVNINNYFLEAFGSFSYYHSMSVLVKLLLGKEEHQNQQKTYLYIHDTHFDCIIIENGKLLLSNSYQYLTPEDLLYYVLFAFEQLQLNPDNIETVLMGTIAEDDATYEILYMYIRNLSFFSEANKTRLNEEDKEHQHVLLKEFM